VENPAEETCRCPKTLLQATPVSFAVNATKLTFKGVGAESADFSSLQSAQSVRPIVWLRFSRQGRAPASPPP
jgi:hypothetical protein